MRKVEIPDELEKVVSQLCDALLKHAGLAAHDAVTAVKNEWMKIKSLDEPSEPENK